MEQDAYGGARGLKFKLGKIKFIQSPPSPVVYHEPFSGKAAPVGGEEEDWGAHYFFMYLL